jgi:hypothetical protein
LTRRTYVGIFIMLSGVFKLNWLLYITISIRPEFPDRDSMKKLYVCQGSHLPTYLPGHLVINLTARWLFLHVRDSK